MVLIITILQNNGWDQQFSTFYFISTNFISWHMIFFFSFWSFPLCARLPFYVLFYNQASFVELDHLYFLVSLTMLRWQNFTCAGVSYLCEFVVDKDKTMPDFFEGLTSLYSFMTTNFSVCAFLIKWTIIKFFLRAKWQVSLTYHAT